MVDDFDVKYGTDTSGLVPLWNLTIASPNVRYGVRYEATTEHELVSAIEFLPDDPRELTFIDLGCGKGRTLLVASALGFKEVIGVEFALDLAEIARTNVQKRGVGNAIVLHADAADFRFPQTDIVVYLYNPFTEEIARHVVANLREVQGGMIYVIYKRPQCAGLLDSSGFLRYLGSPQAAPHIHIWSTTDRGITRPQSS
jgi:SAM-dependent methyltransferase